MKTKQPLWKKLLALRHVVGAVFFLFATPVLAEPWWQSVVDPALRQCIAELATQRQWQNADDVDEIVCHGKSIRQLTGLPILPRLQKLSVYNNQLTSIDVHDLPQLKHLNVARNRLQQFSVNNLPQLTELMCFDNTLPRLTLIDLPQLKLLKCNVNKLREFSYDKLPELEKIHLFNNQMTTIDIDHLPALRYMDVRQNPMPDELYQRMDKQKNVTYWHDGNAADWKQ